jgi:hypothetical protein
MPYQNLAEVRQAYASGELTAPLMLDNDCASLYQDDDKVYDTDPHDLLEDALNLLGIKWEHVLWIIPPRCFTSRSPASRNTW